MTQEEKALSELYDAGKFRDAGHKLIDLLADYLSGAQSKQVPVNTYRQPEEMNRRWLEFLSQSPSLQDFFQKVLNESIHLHHPHYMGHQVSVPSPLGALGGLISDILNNGMAVYEMGSVANVLEKFVIDLLNKAIGYTESSSGFLTSGGTLANLTALLTARRMKIKEDIWQEGYGQKSYAVMVSEQAHYCIDRAVRIMGLGSQGIIKIPVNERFQLDVSLLEKYFHEAASKGVEVFAIVGSSCSTSTGSYDDLNAIGAFARSKNLWFHVDGAHGGAAIFSNRYHYLVDGMEFADSVIIDCHKMMMAPTLATAVLYRNMQSSFSTFRQKAEYLYNEVEDFNWYDSGKRTFECTKLMMSVKIMSILLGGGLNSFGANVDTLYGKAARFAEMIRNHPEFELALTPEANIICFRYIGGGLDPAFLDDLNQNIRKKLLSDGDFYIVQTLLNSRTYLRTTIMNPFTTEEHFTKLLDSITAIAGQFTGDCK